MPDVATLRHAVVRLRNIQSELDRQLQEVLAGEALPNLPTKRLALCLVPYKPSLRPTGQPTNPVLVQLLLATRS